MSLFCFCGKSVVVLFFSDFLVSNVSVFTIFFWIPFSAFDYMTNDTAFPVGVNEGNIENFVTWTRKRETAPEKLVHGADNDKV